MDKKILAIVVVVIVIVAAAAVVVVATGDDDDDEDVSGMSIIGRVNTDGSGIYVLADYADTEFVTIKDTLESGDDYYLGEEGAYVVLNKEAWAGQVFGVPGTATIQYVHLQQIAETMGLDYVAYTVDTTIDSNTLYYVSGISTYAGFVSGVETYPAMIGAIIWEAQYSVALVDGCVGVVTTNELFPGHTCCIIGATNEYLAENSDTVIRFLAAYIETVDRLNAAIEAGSGDDYETLLEVAVESVTMPDSLSSDEQIEAIVSAFQYVVYTYADASYDGSGDPLSDLVDDVADLAVSLYDGGNISNSYSDLGFDSATELAEKFVDSSYLVSALEYEKEDSYSSTTTITVAVIAGDIHQLAIHFGIELGIFADYGLNIELSSQSAGPGVYTALTLDTSSGGADIGFLGAPPMTINSMNNEDITA